ncbi:hypothetical protein MNB_SM-3-1091 [hydrothermal vent metagenome]|uniref:Methyltransferase type 11 domain-containing protein n=1 Tax=hydrothermal vent metagenome TaxID=652676 RepID=A0A1W1D4E9_9ZZZZ
MKELEYWIEKDEINELYTAKYWNDIENEKTKEWYIEDENDSKVLDYLKRSGLYEEFEIALHHADIKGKVLDVAAGVCWTSAILSLFDSVDEIDALEFSLHRIDTLAPRVIGSLNGKKEKINRIVGSFYDIKREDNYYDTIVLSSSYHHAEFPLKLFHECDRVLKPNGTIIIVGENIISYKRVIGRFIKNLFQFQYKLDVCSDKYNVNDDPLGDHYYTKCDYRFTFASYGYQYKEIKSNIRGSIAYIGVKGK